MSVVNFAIFVMLGTMSADDGQPEPPPTTSAEQEQERWRVANEIAQLLKDAGYVLDLPKRH
jgi:hypothetical protein